MTRALVIGEALVDVIDGVARPGGSPVNVAVGLSRLGLDVTMATRIGDDAHGRQLDEHLRRSGVRLTSDSRTDAPTSTARVRLDSAGAAHYEFDIDWDIDRPPVDDVDLVHIGSIGAYLEPGASTVEDIVSDAHTRSRLVSFDPNIRPRLVGGRAAAARRTERLASKSHIVKLSDEDAAWLFPGTPLDAVLRRLRTLGARVVIATRGSRGCCALAGDQILELPAPEADVVDTVGAGDAFMSGFLAAVMADGGARRIVLGAAPVRGWSEALETGLRSAALTVARQGADPPWLSELR